jgi:hypothetical protein
VSLFVAEHGANNRRQVSKWEFWGSATDVSWGVFTTESGWTAGWVAAMMGLRQLNSSLWDAAAPFGATLNRTLARELCLRYFEGDQAPCAPNRWQ